MCDRNKVMVYDAVTLELTRKEIDKDYRALQKEVGGCIEAPILADELERNEIDTFINEEGKLLSLPVSACVLDDKDQVVDLIAGNIVFASHDEDGDTVSLTDEQMAIVENLCANKVFAGSYLGDMKMLIGFK